MTQKIFHQLIEVAAKQWVAERMHEDNDLVIKHILPLSTSAKIEDISPDGIQGLKERLEQDKTDIVRQAGIRYRMALLLGNDVYKSIPDDADHYWVLHLFQADDDGRGEMNRIQKTFSGVPSLTEVSVDMVVVHRNQGHEKLLKR